MTSETAKTYAEQAAERASERLGESAEQIRHAATDGLDHLEIAIRRNPVAATAIAAGIGFFLAVLARR